MPLLRPLAWLLGLVLLIVALIAVFALTFDANRYKPEMTALVKEQTGRDLTLNGDINLSFYPDIALQLGEVALGNAKGFTAENFAEAKDARVTVQFLPLLEQQLKVNQVHLQGLKLNLHRAKDGKTNWQDLLPEDSPHATAGAGEAMTSLLGGLVVTGVSVTDSEVNWRDEQLDKTLTLAPLNLKTGMFTPGDPVDISLNTNLKQNQPALDVDLQLTTTAQLDENKNDFSLTKLTMQAQLPGTLDASIVGNLQGKLDKEQASIPDLQADINLPGQGKLKLSGKLDANLAKELLKLGDMRLQADLQGGALPVTSLAATAAGDLSLQMSQQQLDITGLKLGADVKAEQVPGGQLQQQASGKLSLNLESGKGLLDLSKVQFKTADQQLDGSLQVRDPLLPARVVEGKFKADQFSYPPFALQQAKLNVFMENGQVKLTPSGKLFQGAYQGTINIDTLLTPMVVRSEHKVQKLRTEELLFALTDDRLVTGALDMTAKLDSVAGDAKVFKQNLNGTLDLELNDGSIRDANFAQKTKEVVKLFEKESVNEMGEKEVAFTKLAGQWQVQQGVFHTEENTLVAPHFQIKGNGDVNIVDESLDFKLRVGEKPKADKPQGLFAPLHIFGAWKKPSYELELDVLLKEMADQEIEKQKAQLKGKFDAEKQKQIDALQQKRDEIADRLKSEVQGEQNKLEDALKNKLKSLF
ncbi:AsmA family protein [Thiothrix lacustris]|uniref:AsmA family protein n=1 Tax=Thiothrix lacustris TaxID=525917 RepID=UPI00048D13C2|nr:AsmA family protein [Thiothrix lacustris]